MSEKGMLNLEKISNGCYENLFLCIIKSNMFSWHHIIAICGGWIFNGDLNYALPLSDESFNWYASYGCAEIVFDIFFNKFNLA